MHPGLKDWRSALAVCLLLLVPAVGAAQTATFHTLPKAATGTGQPVTRARIVLELASNLDASDSITIGSTNVLANDALTPLGDGDLARLSGAGSRFATLELNIRSILNDPTSDKCTLAPGQDGSKSYTFTLNGFPTVTGHRLTGFSAPSVDACMCQSRRVDAALWDTPPPGTDGDRVPMDIVLVLDRSGSMASPTPGDPANVPKWDALDSAVGQFVDLWKLEGASAGDPASNALARDRLALVYFSTDPETVLFGGTPFVARGTGGDVHPWDAIRSNVAGRDPGGLTALGGGIHNALNASSSPENDVTFVVMTDGMQNRPPMVADGTGPNVGLKVLNLAGGSELVLRSQCTPMLTVAVGNATTPWAELMDAIAQQTAGTSRLTAGLGMPSAFNAVLVDALKGSTLSIALDKKGSFPRGGDENAQSTPVFLDSSVRNAMVMLSWLGAPATEGRPLELTLRRPDGTVARPTRIENGRTYTAQRIDLPADGPPGEWTVEVGRLTGLAIPYQLTVFAEETGLDMNFGFARKRHGTGEPITLNANLRFKGEPLKNLGEGLTVRLERPQAALGTLLHEQRAPQVQLPDVNDQLPPYEKKLLALSTNPEFRQQVGPQQTQKSVPLKELGDGRYAFTVEDTKAPGTYRFHLALDTKTPEGDILRRVETLETKVEVIPDGPSSTIKTERTGEDTFVIHVVPRDQFGNFQGPGYDDRFGVRIDGEGRLEAVTDPDVRGDYRVGLVGVKEDTPITLSVANSVIARGPVTKLEPVPREKPEQPEPPKGRSCAHCAAAGGDAFLLFSLPFLALLTRRWARRRR